MTVLESLQEVLADSLGQVMQNMCFILVSESDDASSTEKIWVERVLEFSGPVRGEFRIRAPFDSAAHIASDFLGEDLEQLTATQIHEVISEMANVVCGNVLGNCYPSNAFSLTSPRQPEATTVWHGRKFAWDDGMVEVYIHSETAD